MSSKISSADKKSDAKATVSFNSDSEDEDSSTSSRLSSSAPSEDESEVETVTFAVPLPSQDSSKTADSSVGKGSQKAEHSKKAVHADKDAKANEDATHTGSRLSSKKADNAESTTKASREEVGDDMQVMKLKSATTERAKSPKITINDVEDSSAGNDVRATEKNSKKDRSPSPKKSVKDVEVGDDVGQKYSATASKDSDEGRRANSPRKSNIDETEEVILKPARKSSKLSASSDREKFQKNSPQEIELTTKAEKNLKEQDEESSRLSRKANEESETRRSKSPKVVTEESDLRRAKSPKNSEEKEIATKTKSPRKSSEDQRESTAESNVSKETEDVRKKSLAKDTNKSLDDFIGSLDSPEKSPTRHLKASLEAGHENENQAVAEEMTKPKKTKKSSKTSAKEDDAKVDKPPENTVESKVELSKKNRDDDEILFGASRNKTGNEESAKVTDDDLGKTDSRSLVEEPRKFETGENDTKKDTVGKTSQYLRTNEAAENRKELENEDSEFTYRRKSMDEFIKRILAEAREEKIKQKQALTNDTAGEGEGKKKSDDYKDYNGDIGLSKEVLSKPPKWSGASKTDRETSNLDRRLASIEKRKFGGDDSGKEGDSKGQGQEQDGTVKKKSTLNDSNGTDFDMNLDEDLAEINKFLQSRKSAASRFDFDDTESNNDSAGTKRRWLTENETQGQRDAVNNVNSDGGGEVPVSASKSQSKMKYGVDLDFNEDDERSFLARFRRERDSAIPEDSFTPRRRDDTDEIVRERTRNVRVLVDQQVEIIQAMRSTSKNLDDLEKEIREVRQVCLNRQARIEALEGALHAEYRAFENDQMAASDRQRPTEEFGRSSVGRRPEEELLPFRCRSGSVTSTSSFSSAFGPGRPSDICGDFSDLRPPSGLRQQRGRAESEAGDYQEYDRRRAGSVNRDRPVDINPFSPDEILNQRPARSRASIATSSPAVDLAGLVSGDSFLAKIRAKYSFLAPSLGSYDPPLGSSSLRSSGFGNIGSSLSSSTSRRYGVEDTNTRSSKDFLTSPITSSLYSSPTSVGNYIPSRYSIRDSKSPSYGSGGFVGLGSTADSTRMRRAQSVTDFSYDRPIGSSSHLGSSGAPSTTGGEFHSRFLDKVRGKKAMGEESTTPAKSQEKPFKSRFLRTPSFDSSSSKPLANGGLELDAAGGSEVTRST